MINIKLTQRIIAITLIILLITILIDIPKVEVKAASEMRVLYLGNSKTFHNIFPRMYRHLAKAGGKPDPKFKAVVAGSRTLKQHADILESIHDKNGNIRKYEDVKKIIVENKKYSKFLEDEYDAYVDAFKQKWDYIVLQEQTDNSKDKKEMLSASQRIIKVLKKYTNPNLKVIYNAIWDKYPDTSVYTTYETQMAQFNKEQTKINNVYKEVAAATGGTVSYSGQAIYNYLKYINKNYTSMYKDGNHPTQAGSYLSACCLYVAMHNKSPVGINYYGKVADAKSNPIINLNFPADHKNNGSDFTGRKSLDALDANIVASLQNIAHRTMINKAPTVNLASNNTNLTNQNITLTATVSDTPFELDRYPYSWDGKASWTAQNYTTVSQNGTYTVFVKDNMGNTSTSSITVANIDKTAPTGTVTYDVTTPTKGNVTVTITSNEELQGVTGWNLSANKKVLTKTYSEKKTEKVIIKDLAGNTKEVTVTVNNIDKQAPILNINYSNKFTTTDDITVTITANEEIAGIAGWTLSQNKRALVKTYKNNTNVPETVTIRDLAGNGTTTVIEIKNIITLQSTRYTIEGNYILNVKPNTSVSDLRKNIRTSKNYKITRRDDIEIAEKDTIGTGYKIKFENNEIYEIVVNGDIDGDGIISITDIVRIKKHLIEKEKLQGLYEKAGDVSGDNKITITDLARIKKIIIGIINI